MRQPLCLFSKDELSELYKNTYCEYDGLLSEHLTLNMARGKPSSEQLDLSEDILNSVLTNQDCFSKDNVDCRNYGEFYGLKEIRELFSQIIGVPAKNIIVGGNSSLTLMYDTVSRAMLRGVANSPRPWAKEETVKMICPVPGYDRHYTICESLGIEMIPVPLTGQGPDMDIVESIVANDESVKGIWIIPVYSNPTGDIYSEEVLRRLASMDAKAKDFTIICDDAYPLHTLNGTFIDPIDLFSLCEKAGHPDRPIIFASTSKVSFAAGGVSCIAMSDNNLKVALPALQAQFICMDKVNQLRHAKVFPDIEHIKTRMIQHCEILRPKFDLVENGLSDYLSGYCIAEWNHPEGGYFISLKVTQHTAKRVVELCKNAGLILTSAGAGFPYSHDPDVTFIRLAPSFPSTKELRDAPKLLSICIILASCEHYLKEE